MPDLDLLFIVGAVEGQEFKSARHGRPLAFGRDCSWLPQGTSHHGQEWVAYPTNNDLEPIEDPGQARNALTVGAHTDLVDFNLDGWPNLRPIAPAGSLSPSSRTSLLWPDR
jgi:hypothetical protein